MPGYRRLYLVRRHRCRARARCSVKNSFSGPAPSFLPLRSDTSRKDRKYVIIAGVRHDLVAGGGGRTKKKKREEENKARVTRLAKKYEESIRHGGEAIAYRDIRTYRSSIIRGDPCVVRPQRPAEFFAASRKSDFPHRYGFPRPLLHPFPLRLARD